MRHRKDQEIADDGGVDETPNSILEETDQSGGVTSYLCGYHIGTGAIQPDNGKVIDSYYEMLLPCDSGTGSAVRTVASELLDSLGTTFGLLPDGSACTVPDTWLDAWIIGASSAPVDAIVANLGCSVLSPRDDATCCVVVEAPMTFWVTDAGYQEKNVMKYVAEALNAGSFSYPTAYVGAMLDFTVAGGLPTTRNDDDTVVAGIARGPTGRVRENISITGGLIIAGIAFVAALGLAVIVHRGRRQRRVPHVSLDKAADDGVLATDCESNHGGHPGVDVNAMDDEALQPAQLLAACGQPCAFGAYDGKDEGDSPMFEMADCMKGNIMSQYGGFRTFGPTSVVGSTSNLGDEASDSEADSWAQTEGTVGSLDDNNYVGQITGEI